MQAWNWLWPALDLIWQSTISSIGRVLRALICAAWLRAAAEAAKRIHISHSNTISTLMLSNLPHMLDFGWSPGVFCLKIIIPPIANFRARTFFLVLDSSLARRICARTFILYFGWVNKFSLNKVSLSFAARFWARACDLGGSKNIKWWIALSPAAEPVVPCTIMRSKAINSPCSGLNLHSPRWKCHRVVRCWMKTYPGTWKRVTSVVLRGCRECSRSNCLCFSNGASSWPCWTRKSKIIRLGTKFGTYNLEFKIKIKGYKIQSSRRFLCISSDLFD